MTVWSTEVEARVQVSEELTGALMLALAAAFAEPKPALALGSGRIVRLEVEAAQGLLMSGHSGWKAPPVCLQHIL